MENQLNENEKMFNNISNNKKYTIVKKRINLISLDKFKDGYNSNIIKKNDNTKNNEIIIGLENNGKNKSIENNNKYEEKKIKLKFPLETIHKRKVLDYISFNKNSNNLNLKQESIKENNFINNIYKENYENKKRLEDLINDFSLKQKIVNNNKVYNPINNTIKVMNIKRNNVHNNISLYNNKNYNDNDNENEINSIKKEKNREKESKEKNISLVSDSNNNNNYQNKRPFYALDCKIYCKNNKIEKNTPFINKVIHNRAFSKKLRISTNDYNSEKSQETKKRKHFRVNPINLSYNDKIIIIDKNVNDNNSNISSNNNANNLYTVNIEENNNNSKKELTEANNQNIKRENYIYKNFIKNENILNNKEINPYKKIDIFSDNISERSDGIQNKNSRNPKIGINRKHRSFNRYSFNFLVNQTNRNRQLSLSFNKRYKSKRPSINSVNYDLKSNDSLTYSNIHNETDTNIDQDSYKSFNLHNDKRYHFDKDKRNIKYINSQKICGLNEDSFNKNLLLKDSNITENRTPYYNRVINDNYIEFTPTLITNTKETTQNNINDDKVSNKYREKNGTTKMKRFKQMLANNPQCKVLNNQISTNYSSLSPNTNFNSVNANNSNNSNSNQEKKDISEESLPISGRNFYSLINLELLYFLEEKMRNVIEKIKNYEKCSEECNQYINYYFIHSFYIEELRAFKINQNREFMINYLKMELLCYFLLYNISQGFKFKEAKILLKTIFEILYKNFLLFLSLIISQNHTKDSNIIVFLKKIINNNLDKDNFKDIFFDINDLDENKFIEIILTNSKSIDDYYKMIINNIYTSNINQDYYIKFPDCININPKELDKNKMEIIIETFFIESYKSLSIFNFDLIKKFYYSFLNINNLDEKNNNVVFPEKKFDNDNINFNNNIITEKEKKYLLPEIKDKKYTLILDLDETLIYAQRSFNFNLRKSGNNINKKRIILRPCLCEFLHEMKLIFELIIFSSGTPDYVDPIIKIIEKNEKYFDYILYRHHITLDEDGNNVKNLDLIGRDLKKVIIIDDIPRYFHLQKRNGINIKPFCGNILSDTKTLKTLNTVLKKIRVDVDETDDIRISLEKYKHLLYPNVINEIE